MWMPVTLVAVIVAVLASTLLRPRTVEAQALTSLAAESVLESPIEVSDLTPTSAALRIDSTLDLACVVVYGQDERFGQLALDQDMGGSAHRDHFVIMRGLEPDTEYLYRLQGSDTEGNFYASAVMRFRTPNADAATDVKENLALGATVSAVSSNYGGGDNDSSWGANNAIDGDQATEWSSASDGDDAYITVQLAEEVDVGGFGLWTRTMGSSAQIGQFVVESDSGEVFGPFELPDAGGLYEFSVEGRGRSFTFRVVDSSGGNTGVVELAIYPR
jgi:hypothetical protein